MAGKDSIYMAQRVLDHHDLVYEIKRGKHVKIVVDYDGRKQTLVTGGSLSDNRAILNFYHTVKRLLIALGVEFKADSKALIFN